MSLDKLRSLPEFQGASDAEIIGTLAKTAGAPIGDVASAFGMDKGGKWGNRMSASVDSYQAGLYGVGEALFGSDMLGAARRRNEAEAELARSTAQRKGAVMSYKDVGGLGDAVDYAGGLAVDSLPYLAESFVGGLAARGLSTGLRGLSSAGRMAGATDDVIRAGAAADRALTTRSMVGGAAASYPSSVGDVLQSQREQAGSTDLGAAALLGVPYAAANMFGVEGMASRGMTARGISALDNLQGLKGGLARTGATVGLTGLSEGANETFQEGMNQLGRMAVDPSESFFNERSNDRFAESFVGGATLGGAFGSAGGWRRSEGYKPPLQENTEQGRATDLLGIGFDPSAAGRIAGLPDSFKVTSDGTVYADDYSRSWTQQNVNGPYSNFDAPKELARTGLMGGLNLLQLGHDPRVSSAINGRVDAVPVLVGSNGQVIGNEQYHGDRIEAYDVAQAYGRTLGQNWSDWLMPQTSAVPSVFTQPAPLQQRIDQNLGINAPGAPKNYPSQFRAAASEPTNMFAQDPATGLEQRLDIGQLTALRVGDGSQVQNESIQQANAVAQRIKAEEADAAQYGIKGGKGVKVFTQLRQMLADGDIDQQNFNILAGTLSARKYGDVEREIRSIYAQAEQKYRIAAADAEAKQSAIDKVQQKASNGTPTTQAQQAAPQGSQAPAAAAPAAAAPAAAVSTQAPVVSGEAPVVAGTLAERTKAKWDEMATATPGMPAYETLTKGQIARAEDLVNREVFNLAGASNVVGSGDNLPATKTAGGEVAGIAEGKTVSIGRKGREKSVTASELVTKMEKATPLEKARIAAAVGFEATVDPTTGAPKLVQIGEPQTLEAIAAAESKVTGKKVTKEAIRLSLIKFGITPEVIDRVQAVAVNTVSAEELAINPEENGSGYRVETQASKATGQGLVDDGVGETKKQREARAQADEILKAAGPSTELAMADDRPTNLPEGAVVTDLRENNPSTIDANIQALLNHREANNAAADWDDGVVSWDALPDTLKVEWIEEYVWNMKANDGEVDFKELEGEQKRIESEYERYRIYAGQQASTRAISGGNAGAGSRSGMVEGAEAERPQLSDQSSGSRDAEKVTDVEDRPVTPFTQEVTTEPVEEKNPAAKPKTVADMVTLGQLRMAGKIWGQYAPEGVKWESQSPEQQKQWAVVAIEQRMPNMADAQAIADGTFSVAEVEQDDDAQVEKAKFSKSSKATNGSNAKTLAAELRAFMRVGTLGNRVVVVQSAKDIPAGVQRSVGVSNNTQGFVFGGKAYLIADQIAAGDGRAVFMHEVGAHLGLEEMLGAHYDKLVGKIMDWAKRMDNSLEFKLADKAMERALAAAGDGEFNDTELVAYFIEEAVNAGIEPSALKHGPLRQFLQAVVDAFKNALRKFGVNPDKVTAQDFVDLAYGAARIEMKEPINPGGGDGAPKFSKRAEDLGRKVAGETGAKIAVDTGNLAGKALGALTYLHDLVDSAKAKLPSAEKWYKATQDITAARNRMEQDAERIVKMFTESGIRADKVNKLLFDATFEQKWPYDTERLDRKTGQMVTLKADPELAERFDNELTAKERAVVKAVFAHGEKTLDHKYAVLKKLGLNGTFKAETGKLQGPYAPLKRFGNYISVLKSADLVAAEDAGDEKLAEKLKADPEHYEVRFHDTKGQASEYAQANAKTGGQSYHFEKSERVGDALPMNNKVLANIRAALKMDDKMPAQARTHFEQMLQELEFQALDEHHARTSGLTRKNRAGAEEDMMRSFLANAKAQANFLAQLEYGKEANMQFYAMQREAAKDGYAGQDDFNLLAKHYAASFDTRDTPIQNRLTATTTAFQLATSLGYHITNALQGVMVTVPKLAADFDDYTGAMDQLHSGYKTWLAAGGLKGKFDINGVKDTGLRAALQHAADMGVLDVGMTEDLSQFEAFRTGYKGVDAASGKMSKLMHKLNQVSRYVETANRVSAATAAYNMAMAKHGDQAKAQEYATRILQTTQGDFSATGAPLIFKKLPKFVMQYKKYQFMMASLYANAAKQAFSGATPEERAIGRRFLTYKLATTGVAAGFLGLPLMNVAALVFGMTGDDDEPKDLERSLREWIGDEGLADLVLRGPLNAIGLDMSAKLGDDKVFSIAPYTDIDFSSGSAAAKTILGVVGGPSVGQALRMATGIEYLSKGDLQKGFENLVPSGLANASKALRIANEGYTLKNGTVMYSPDEISGMSLLFDAIGLKSSEMKHMEWVRGQQYEIGQFVSERTKELKANYVQAYRDGDTDELSKLSEHWLKLQEVKRELRPMFNNSVDELKTQPLSDLLRSPANALKRDMKAQKASW